MNSASEAEVLFRLFELNLGHEVSIFGGLYVRPLDDGRFAVGSNGLAGEIGWEECFDSSIVAIDRFIELRHQFGLGLDHEHGKT